MTPRGKRKENGARALRVAGSTLGYVLGIWAVGTLAVAPEGDLEAVGVALLIVALTGWSYLYGAVAGHPIVIGVPVLLSAGLLAVLLSGLGSMPEDGSGGDFVIDALVIVGALGIQALVIGAGVAVDKHQRQAVAR